MTKGSIFLPMFSPYRTERVKTCLELKDKMSSPTQKEKKQPSLRTGWEDKHR